MAVTNEIFPARRRRHSADASLTTSLLLLSHEIYSLQPLRFILRRNSLCLLRTIKALATVFEDLLHSHIVYSQSLHLRFQEMHIVTQRVKILIDNCSHGSKLRSLMHIQLFSSHFHEIITDLSTLLDILPVNEFPLTGDVQELLLLLTKQCAESKPFVDPRDDDLRREVIDIIDGIRRQIAPDHSRLNEIFTALGFRDSSSFTDEIERLEDKIQKSIDERSKSVAASLMGLVRYAKYVLHGPLAPPQPEIRRNKSVSETNIPVDFRCPITLELMRDPVVISTGQTYDRESIDLWIKSGHKTCPKTGQTLKHTDLIPNRALKNLIALWCREQKIPFEISGEGGDGQETGGGITSEAVEFTKMTVLYLINKLSVSPTMDESNNVVYELRALAKSNPVAQACTAEAGAIPKLVRYLGSEHPSLQVNAVTTILNLSVLDENKTRIMETDKALNGVINVLQSGATWEAKANAAATLFNLSGIPSHRRRLGRETRVVKGLVELAKQGPTSSKKDALVAIRNLARERKNVGRFVEGGVVEVAGEALRDLPEEAVAVVETVVRKGGLVAVTAALELMRRLGEVLREGTEAARESAAATLVTMCRKGGSEMVGEVAEIPGIERLLWEMIGTGTPRTRRKVASLIRHHRRWAAIDSVDHPSTAAAAETQSNVYS